MENNAPDTNNFLNWVEIKNFKSIKDLRLDCKRVNVFIGKPNVGKSNILEGLGLLGMVTNTDKIFAGCVRYESLDQLFHDGDTSLPIAVKSNIRSASLSYEQKFEQNEIYFDFVTVQPDNNYRLTKTGKAEIDLNLRKAYVSHIRKYAFGDLTVFDNSFPEFLLPPYGPNLFSVVDRRGDLKNEFGRLFADQNLELVLSKYEKLFELQKRNGMYVTKYTFFSIADTFRRFMFYITAIESNKNSVILFEEPEVHSFPPYTQDIAYRMIYSEANQFFVSTHSPYLLQTLVSNLGDDQLNVFVTYYEDYETKVKMLTPEEIGFVQEYSTDVFFNLDRFVPNAQSANPA